MFNGYAKVAKVENPAWDIDSRFLYFKGWEKYGKKRIYVNDYKKRTLGYIENGKVFIRDNQGSTNEEVETALNNFMTTYEF